jgi:integrase
MAKLTALAVTRLSKPGFHGDGGGLYLQVGPSGGKSWVFRYRRNAKTRYMGLGGYPAISLARARELVQEPRRLHAEGLDPLAEKRATAGPVVVAPTFREIARGYIATHEHGWRSAAHRQQWQSTMETDVFPTIGNMPVADVDTAAVLRVLQPIWTTKPTTADRIRNRISLVLAAAKAAGLRSGENPAQWRGHLENLLPAPRKLRPVVHLKALAYRDVPAFVAELRRRNSISAAALLFAILTAGRRSEVLGARWAEVDLVERTWTIPGSRMKAGKEHRIPLSVAAVDILRPLYEVRSGPFVFPGKPGRSLSEAAMQGLLRVMQRTDLTTHGFRSSFKDWASEQTAFPSEVVEQALAHTIGSAVERAYRRGDLFEKRARLMDEWSKYCAQTPTTAEVVPIRK